jgi:hypothetical protein
MDEELLNHYIESVIIPLYPNMHKTAVFNTSTGKLNQGPVILKLDAGPGRIVSSENVLAKRKEFFERGLIIIMGLPNATSVQQEMDDLLVWTVQDCHLFSRRESVATEDEGAWTCEEKRPATFIRS